MRIVSEEYKQKALFEKNNREHKYKIFNKTRDLDLTPLYIPTSLVMSRFLRTSEGKISPNNVKLTLKGEWRDTPYLVKEFNHMYKEFQGKTWQELSRTEKVEEFLCKFDDEIIIEDTFNEEKLVVFTGKVTSHKATDTSRGRTIEVTVDDNTVDGYDKTFSEDIVFNTELEHFIPLSDNKDKEHSILHIVCNKYLGIPMDKLEIDDIDIRIPLVRFKKGTKIMQELAEIVRGIYGNIYTMPNGNLKINSWLDKTYLNNKKYDFTIGDKKGNYPILYFVTKESYKPKNNKVDVKYESYVAHPRQAIACLYGQNYVKADDDARISLSSTSENGIANTSCKWIIRLPDAVNVEKEPYVRIYYWESKLEPESGGVIPLLGEKTPEEIAVDDHSPVTPIESPMLKDYTYLRDEEVKKMYNIEFKDSDVYVKFNKTEYSTKDDITLQAFKIIGRPVEKLDNSIVTYSEVENANNSKSVYNKYITSERIAQKIAFLTYAYECREYNTITLRTNNCPFLELEDIIKVDYKKYTGTYQIISIKQANDYTELVLRLYEDFVPNELNFATYRSGKSDSNFMESTLKRESALGKVARGTCSGNAKIDLANADKYDITVEIERIYTEGMSTAFYIGNNIKASSDSFKIECGYFNDQNELVKPAAKVRWIARPK